MDLIQAILVGIAIAAIFNGAVASLVLIIVVQLSRQKSKHFIMN